MIATTQPKSNALQIQESLAIIAEAESTIKSNWEKITSLIDDKKAKKLLVKLPPKGKYDDMLWKNWADSLGIEFEL